MTLFKGAEGGENFFLALVEPPSAITTAQINPREYIFVVDISGSMHGFPLDTAKVLLRELIGGLRPSDRFNVMLFSGSNRMLSETSVAATKPNIERAIWTIEQMRAGGSTEIVPALERIAALPKESDVSRSVIVITAGHVTVEDRVFQLVRKNLGQSASGDWQQVLPLPAPDADAQALQPLSRSAVEARFAAAFPGRIGRFRLPDSGDELVLRDVQRPTRMLHPAADCWRGIGWKVGPARLAHLAQTEPSAPSALWRCIEASQGGQRVQVCERIVDAHGQVFTDTSAWFWAASLGQSAGPWRAVTTVREL